jgi:hypothetical protein
MDIGETISTINTVVFQISSRASGRGDGSDIGDFLVQGSKIGTNHGLGGHSALP